MVTTIKQTHTFDKITKTINQKLSEQIKMRLFLILIYFILLKEDACCSIKCTIYNVQNSNVNTHTSYTLI